MQQVPSSNLGIRKNIIILKASLVQWLEYAVANGVARVRFPDDAKRNVFFSAIFATTGNRTRSVCLGSKHVNHYTIVAPFKI